MGCMSWPGELKRLRWSEAELTRRRKGDEKTTRIALRLRRESTMTPAWIARCLTEPFSGKVCMRTPKKSQINWGSESLKLEKLDCKGDPLHLELLMKYIIRELTKKVISKSELRKIKSTDEIRFHVRN